MLLILFPLQIVIEAGVLAATPHVGWRKERALGYSLAGQHGKF
jgi:hypothetical protein